MNIARLFFGVIGGVVVMLGAAAAQQTDLPPGPNREVVSRKCQGCHDLSVVVEAAGLRLIPLTQVRLYVVGAAGGAGRRFCEDCLA
jgi:hypothetical protein